MTHDSHDCYSCTHVCNLSALVTSHTHVAHHQDTKWIGLHMDKCEELGVSWPPAIPKNLQDNDWLACAPQREREIVCLAALEDGVKWVDSSQNITRCRNSSNTSSPTVLPGCHLWNFEAGRYMTGRDLMRLQGYPWETLRDGAKWSDHQLADLAGNAFALSVSCALDVAILLAITKVEQPAEDMLRFIDPGRSTGEGEEGANPDDDDAPWEFDL